MIYIGDAVMHNAQQKMHPLAESIKKASKSLRFKGMVGVTTFIKNDLMRNIKYVPPPEARIKGKGKKAKSSVAIRRRGLSLGRRLDKSLQEYVEKGTRCVQIAAVIRRLKASGLTLIAVQVPVAVKRLKIKTHIDALAINGSGDVYCVELKNTQMSISQHEKSYHLPAMRNSKLTNGLLNSEHNRHGLQAFFGTFGLQECYSIKSRALVIVNCANGVRLQRFESNAFTLGHFY